MRVFISLLFLVLAVSARAGEGGDPLSVKPTGGSDLTLVRAPAPVILYEEDPTLLTSTIEVVVLAGAADDPAGRTGVASMMGELLLRGTRGKSRSAFQSAIERMGASLSVRASYDKLTFVGRVIKENTGAFMKLVEEALLHPAFEAKEFASLKTEMLADAAHMKNSNGRLVGLALRKTLFEGTALQRPVDGTLGSIKAITRDDVLRAYHLGFTRGALVFAVASPLKEPEFSGYIKEIWQGFPAGERKTRLSIPMKLPSKPTLIVIDKPHTSTGSTFMGQGGITAQDPERFALGVGNYSFGGEPLVSRLFKVVRGELGWTYAIGSTYHAAGPLSDQQGFFLVSSTPSVEFTAKTIFKVLSMWEDYRSNGLKSDELRLAEESLINSYPFEFDSAEKRLSQRLHSYIYHVPLLSPEEYRKTISGIDNDRLKTALKTKSSGDGWLITLCAERAVVEKELADEQAEVSAEKRLVISKTMTPEELVD